MNVCFSCGKASGSAVKSDGLCDPCAGRRQPAKRFNAWNIYHRGRLIETVFYTEECSAEYVKDSMIDHDGFPPGIEVRRVRRAK